MENKETNNMFNIPVALFIFKRTSSLKAIVGRIKSVKPAKFYIIADGPRTEEEKKDTDACRALVESLIDWPCTVVKDYATQNRGVYQNIGEGAKRVFKNEEWAIFLEDDNLPEVTFFEYCKELLNRYKDNEKILWICGTNYLGKYESNYSYMFTQHLLPCGWASWRDKFLKYYDGLLSTFDSRDKQETFKKTYKNKKLYKQRYETGKRVKYIIENDIRRSSWDFQMLYSLRSNDLYGISPASNQIKNIGVDELSTHGGTSWQMVMTKRFCGMPSYPLSFPLEHPDAVEIDKKYEKKIDKIILFPLPLRLKVKIVKVIKKILRIDPNERLGEHFKNSKNK